MANKVTTLPRVGDRARFFHPSTLGVMHTGTVVATTTIYVKVRFDVDQKTYWTYPDRIAV